MDNDLQGVTGPDSNGRLNVDIAFDEMLMVSVRLRDRALPVAQDPGEYRLSNTKRVARQPAGLDKLKGGKLYTPLINSID